MSDFWKLTLVCLVALAVRWLVSLHPHSGQGKPPMFGDFEAQRHWLEITVNLPINEWYRNSSNNDLLYWGLDYPVLTAYHSLAMGKLARLFNSSWMDLHKSRGLEYYEFKLFMRSTVIVSDLIVFIPIALWLMRTGQRVYLGKNSNSNVIATTVVLLGPSLILIDHGHFQYNGISLGLALGAFAAFLWAATDDDDKNDSSGDCFSLPHVGYPVGSMFFVLALCYKQMELYHALPVFFFLLGKCLHQKRFLSGLALLACLGLTVILTFITVHLPFLVPSHEPTFDVLARMFPVDRGLYEDKVASFWCALSTVWKFQNVISVPRQLVMCASACLLSFSPAAIVLLRKPSPSTLLPAVVISSLSFFLFSYHVHEKSILLAICPAVFLLEFAPVEVVWFSTVAAVSMLPLMIKDGLVFAFFGVGFVWAAVVLLFFANRSSNKSPGEKYLPGIYRSLRPFSIGLSAVSGTLISFCLLAGWPIPPATLPFLYPLLTALYSCGHFFIFLIVFYCMLFGCAFDSSSRKCEDKISAAVTSSPVKTRSARASLKKIS